MSDPTSTPSFHGPSRAQATTLIVLLLILLVGLGAWTVVPHPAQKWEYRIEAPSDATFETTMNKLGGEGWELVSARRATSGSEYDRSAAYEMILKRPAK